MSTSTPRNLPVIASQLTAAMHERMAAAFPSLRILEVPPGFPQDLPAEATVFFATPYRAGEAAFPPRPSWVERIEWIHLLSAGADGYPPWYFDVDPVTCSRGPTAQPVAEFALAAVFAHAKRFPDSWIHDRGQWGPIGLDMVRGSTLGIVGYGAIGRELARMAATFGMRVLVSRRNATPDEEPGVTAVSLQTLASEADHLVLAAPATPETHHLVNRELLRAAKRGLHLVNVARGSLVDQDAMVEALDAGQLSAATLDVADPEPLPAGHMLYSHPRVRLSPHVSSYDPALRSRLADAFIENLRRFVAGEQLANRVNAAVGY